MTKKYSTGPIIRFLLYPPVFMIEKVNQGIIVGIGVLLIYPLIATIIEMLKQKIHSTNLFYLGSFLGIFLGSIYMVSVGLVDWSFYKALYLLFPASLTSSVMIMGIFHRDGYDHAESLPFVDALISAFFVVIFAMLREMLVHQSWDLRFGSIGTMYLFFDPMKVQSYQHISDFRPPFVLTPIQFRSLTFMLIALSISFLGFSDSKQGETE